MASEIKVDTIVNAGGDNDTGIDLATNDQILLKVANATKLTMNSTGQTTIVGEGGTTTTSVQQGLAKAWCHWNQDSTQTRRDNFNIATITDGGTGDTTFTYTNNMGNANYAFVGHGSHDIGTVSGFCSYDTDNQTTSQSNKFRSITSANNLFDAQSVQATLHGDLA
jgi:hypothetical protein